MRFLLDTCLLSEFVKTSPQPSVLAWLEQRKPDELFVSTLTLGELHRGVAKLEFSKRRTELAAWLLTLETSFEDRVLSFAHETARTWATMCAKSEAQGRRLAVMDSLIAATALDHRLTLVTRNVRDFASSGVHLFNPWD